MAVTFGEPVGRSRKDRPTGRFLAQTIVAVGLLAVGIVLFWIAIEAAEGDFDPQGPRLAPVLVTGAWVAVCAVYLVQLRPGRAPAATAAEPSPDDAEPARDGAEPPREGAESASGGDGSVPDPDEPGPGERAPVTLGAPVLVAAGLVGFAVALEYAGFVISAVGFFVWTARVLGSRNWIRDSVVAVALSLAIYLSFTRLLDLFLPGGVLPI
ncbi:tripartite tricarboxylate transporter TctB family protein [Micromonospora sp. CA-263727]|uniref:tripartite tricarboxylate transporter TctB family protein n=1 Tax=Micromonospora sp. CA-263727 TaxID=3239967 RepID=UPI003D8E5341